MINSLCARLLDHAARVMPGPRQTWLNAMHGEFAHIKNPLAAIAFALGCVQASYLQRIRDMMIFALITRWVLAAYALFCAGAYLLATALLGAIKATPQIKPEDLGTDPGTTESLSFIQAYPAWQLAVFVPIAGLLVMGAIQLVRRKRSALTLLASGAAIAVLLAVLDLSRAGGSDWPLAMSTGWLIPIIALALVWWLSRRAPDLKPA